MPKNDVFFKKIFYKIYRKKIFAQNLQKFALFFRGVFSHYLVVNDVFFVKIEMQKSEILRKWENVFPVSLLGSTSAKNDLCAKTEILQKSRFF